MRIGEKGPIFGVQDRKPLKGWPPGRIRLRLRNCEYARGYVRPPGGGIQKFMIQEIEGHWWPCFEQGANVNATTEKSDLEAENAGLKLRLVESRRVSMICIKSEQKENASLKDEVRRLSEAPESGGGKGVGNADQ